MNDSDPVSCPHCGSRQLIARKSTRRVFIDNTGERIPLLTTNYTMNHPVIEESSTIYTCNCSWAGNESELEG